ncbi:MAG: cytochrome c1 [Alphaproteobacteria bacterium]|nr:cytochrome c1 [Alphaproteobacteria bacterium]
MFFRKVILLYVGLFAAVSIASDAKKPQDMNWSFDGVFGYFDRQSIQRGFQVYREVCQACHSVKYVSYHNLEQIGFSKEEIKAISADYTVKDGPDDSGEMFDRPAMPSDRFVAPYPNDNAARAANNGALPPDLSLMVKARPNGANYIYSILTGYIDPPEGETVPEGMHYNPYFPGKHIAMTPPLMEGMVTYSDGTHSSVEQMSKDVVNFLQWAAEPEMEQRKIMGVKVILYLIAFTIVFYLVKRRIWSKVI